MSQVEASPAANTAAIRAALERARIAWNAGDHDGYLALYDASVQLHGYSPEPFDLTAVRGFYEQVWAAFPQGRLEFHEVLVDGPTATIRFSLSGRHDGPFMGLEPTGRTIVLPGITILRFAGERCVERWSCADMLGLMVQLGAIPAPGQ